MKQLEDFRRVLDFPPKDSPLRIEIKPKGDPVLEKYGAAGLTWGSEHLIYAREDIPNVVYHELGHYHAYCSGFDTNPLIKDTFLKLAPKQGHNPAEDWAECAMGLVTGKFSDGKTANLSLELKSFLICAMFLNRTFITKEIIPGIGGCMFRVELWGGIFGLFAVSQWRWIGNNGDQGYWDGKSWIIS